MESSKGVCSSGFWNTDQTAMLPTTRVSTHMNRRGSRSTCWMDLDVGFVGMSSLYINLPGSAIVRADIVRRYSVRFARRPNCGEMVNSVYCEQ